METNRPEAVASRAIHPGEILREELIERGIKQKDFAKLIGVLPTHLNEVIKGKRNLNKEFAMKLEKALGISYQFWMNSQNSYFYDLKVLEERSEEDKKANEYESICSIDINLHPLYKFIGIAHKACVDRVNELKQVIGFNLLSSTERSINVSGLFKHSDKVQIDRRNMNTWLVMNWIVISRLGNDIAPYKKGNAMKAAKDIAIMANACDIDAEKLKDCLNGYGIWYLVVEKLDKAPVDAYSTFKDGHPVITVTYRYNDLDKLVFDVLHELCHIDKHLSGEDEKAFISVEGIDYTKDQREVEANSFARDTLIPTSVWKSIMKVGCSDLNPHKVVKTIALAAKERGISPSIAVARYKREANWYKTSAYRSPKIR